MSIDFFTFFNNKFLCDLVIRLTKFFHFKVVEMGKPNQAGFLKIGVQVDERLINVLKNPTIKGRIKLGFSELILHGSNVEREVKAAIRQGLINEIETVRSSFKAITMADGVSRH
jgi:hypothetical protein